MGLFSFKRLQMCIRDRDPIDFTVRNSALVFRAPASTAPCPTFATMANAPFRRDRMAGVLVLICPTGQQEYFSSRGLTPFPIFRNDLPVGLLCRRCRLKIVLASKANHLTGSARAHRACSAAEPCQPYAKRRSARINKLESPQTNRGDLNAIWQKGPPACRCRKSFPETQKSSIYLTTGPLGLLQPEQPP